MSTSISKSNCTHENCGKLVENSDKNQTKYLRKQTKGAIKQSIIKQLSAKNALVPHFIALVDDYMEFYQLSEKLKADIRKRGLTFTQHTATGIEQQRENPSVKNLIQVNRQMISILAQMGLTTDKPTGEITEDESGL